MRAASRNGILAYAAKFASGFYEPFRDAAEAPRGSATAAPIRWIRPTPRKPSREVRTDIDEVQTS